MKRIKFLRRGGRLKCRPHAGAVAAVAAIAILSEGCAERKPRAYPWATAIAVRPRAPLPAPGYKPPPIDDSSPDLTWEVAPPPSRLAGIRQPPRPRIAVQPTPAEPAGNGRTEAPFLAPQLSEQEIASAQQQMNDSIMVAQRNLSSAKGHRLNATQTDLASKVNLFLDESKAAVKEGDWTRARNLAKKAQVLSEELAGSL